MDNTKEIAKFLLNPTMDNFQKAIEIKEEVMSEEINVVAIPDEKPEVTLVGADSNAFNIIGLCKRAARNKYTLEEWSIIQAEMMSGDYDNVLQTAMKYFDVN